MFSKKLGITITMFALLLATATGTALGQVTNVLESIDFDWKYEMDLDPTDVNAINLDAAINANTGADWITGSTPATVDPVTQRMTLGGNMMLQSGNDPTNLWTNVGFTGVEGFSFEIKMKTIPNSTADIAGFIIGLADNDGSTGDEYGFLTVQNSSIKFYQDEDWVTFGTSSNSDVDHVFRVVRNADADGGGWWLWRDTEQLNSTPLVPNTSNAGITNKIYFGAGVSGSWDGTLDIDYVRLTEGAYKPVVPVYNPPTTTKTIDTFDLVYNMDVDPTDSSSIDLDEDGTADWVTSEGGTPVSIDSPGVLTIQNDATLRSGTVVEEVNQGIWPSEQFTAADGFTYEIRMQVEELEEQVQPYVNTFVFALSDSSEVAAMFIGADKIRWGVADIMTDIDNADGQHTFRVARDSDADGGRWWLWRDGELIGENGLAASAVIDNLDAVYCGPAVSGSSEGTVYVDYIGLTDGSFAPEVVTYIPGDANRDGVVNDLDATALADNWQTQGGATWAMGDFNEDGNVDDIDATILASNWQAGSAASVPEPGCLVLLVGGLVVILIRRR